MPTARLFPSLLATAVVLASCTGRDQSISAEIAVQHSAGGPLELARVGPSDWQRVCVLGPYTTRAIAEQALGFPWDVNRYSAIGGDDRINLLVFLHQREVVAYAEHPRHQGDFLHLSPRCLDRQNAQLTRRVGTGGWVHYTAK